MPPAAVCAVGYKHQANPGGRQYASGRSAIVSTSGFVAACRDDCHRGDKSERSAILERGAGRLKTCDEVPTESHSLTRMTHSEARSPSEAFELRFVNCSVKP